MCLIVGPDNTCLLLARVLTTLQKKKKNNKYIAVIIVEIFTGIGNTRIILTVSQPTIYLIWSRPRFSLGYHLMFPAGAISLSDTIPYRMALSRKIDFQEKIWPKYQTDCVI